MTRTYACTSESSRHTEFSRIFTKPKKSWIDPNLRRCVIARFETSAQLVITRDYETDRSISKLKS